MPRGSLAQPPSSPGTPGRGTPAHRGLGFEPRDRDAHSVALRTFEGRAQLGELVVATEVEWHSADAGQVEQETALAERALDDIDETDVSERKFGQHPTGVRGA